VYPERPLELHQSFLPDDRPLLPFDYQQGKNITYLPFTEKCAVGVNTVSDKLGSGWVNHQALVNIFDTGCLSPPPPLSNLRPNELC
jgi:hypothetical protein